MANASHCPYPFNCAYATSFRSSATFHLYFRVIPWSSKCHYSSAYCASKNASSNQIKTFVKKSLETIAPETDTELDSINDGILNGTRLKFRSSSGNQPFWRRVLSASHKGRSIILLNLIPIIYASNIPIIKEVESVINPEAFTVVRFAVAAIPLIPFAFHARYDLHTRNAGMELGFWVALGYLLQAFGLLTSDAGRASFICMFTVVSVPLIDVILGSAIPAYTWFGVIMSVIGVTLLETSGSPPCVGDFLNFLSAVSFGIHMLRTEHISRSTKRENILPLLGYEICTIAFLSIVWYLIECCLGGAIKDLNTLSWTWATVSDWIQSFPWLPALYTGIFSTVLCLWVEMSAMRDVSATEAAIVYGLEPIWGAGFAWILLGERWGVRGWIGASFLLAGSLTVQIMGARLPEIPHQDSVEGPMPKKK